MPKVADVSIWLRWAVDPASALCMLLQPPLLALPTHSLPAPPPVPPSLASRSGQPLHPVLPHLPPHLRPGALVGRCRASRARPNDQLYLKYLKGPGDLALVGCSVLLFFFLRLVFSHSFFSGVSKVGDLEGGEGGAVWGAGVCGCVIFGGGGLGGAGRPCFMSLPSFLPPLPSFLVSPSSLTVPLPPHYLSSLPSSLLVLVLRSRSLPPLLVPPFLPSRSFLLPSLPSLPSCPFAPPAILKSYKRSPALRAGSHFINKRCLSADRRPLAQDTISTTPVSSALNPTTAHFWIDCSHNRLSGP
ncbi:hypothetical protein B0H13DRAFT_2316844 [Mycena leptocephala]|nr:hypothetical protein B0H13DRAFT_2316844 [Mycena leptocephala]